MELILDIFWEKRRVDIEWKQIICAVLLAFLIAGLYNFINAQPKYAEEYAKEQAVPAKNLLTTGTFADILLMPKESIKDKKSENMNSPDAAAKEPNFAVSYGYSESEAENRTKSAKPVKKSKVKAISLAAATNADDHMKHTTKALPDIPVKDVITEIPNIVTGRKDNDGSMENEKTEPGNANIDEIAAGTNRTESDSTDVNGTEAEIPDTDKTGMKPVTLVERFPGFLINEEGYIAGYTDASKFLKDYLVVFPRNAACTGIEKDALKGLEADIYEIYIPANISYIAEGALDELVNLYYIEAAPGNPRFYSENGILYYRNGEVSVCPNRLKR